MWGYNVTNWPFECGNITPQQTLATCLLSKLWWVRCHRWEALIGWKKIVAPFLLSVGMNLEFRPDLVNNVHFNVVLVELWQSQALLSDFEYFIQFYYKKNSQQAAAAASKTSRVTQQSNVGHNCINLGILRSCVC